LEDIAERIYELSESDEGDPTALLNKIEMRLDAISKLKKKYGATVEEILSYRAQAAEKAEQMQHADERMEELRTKVAEAYEKAEGLARSIHERRVTAARTLSMRVIDTLVFLDMPKVTFRVDVTENKDATGANMLSENGIDTVEFMISANSGENLHSLSKVASGGELARMMLALKSVENEQDNTTAMIFDEIDAGVSGKTARKIGLKLLELSRNTQIFCVTHSAQIASLADVHFLISKHEQNGRTETTVTSLDEEGRIRELSRVLGGIRVTDAQRQAAIDMRREKKELSEGSET
jgi:DNA repair protein RecN (Recombination protein N)